MTTEQTMTLSAQFARRLGTFVVHAGLIDGKGGGGAELRFMDDRLRSRERERERESKRPGLFSSGTTNPTRARHRQLAVHEGTLRAGGRPDRQQGSADLLCGRRHPLEDDDLKKLVGLAAGRNRDRSDDSPCPGTTTLSPGAAGSALGPGSRGSGRPRLGGLGAGASWPPWPVWSGLTFRRGQGYATAWPSRAWMRSGPDIQALSRS